MAGERAPKNSPLKRPAQSAEIAFQKLRKAILAGELKEGDVVREIRLVREWKIGRTPLREAIRRAAEFGYMVLRPNHAPIVRKLTPADILQIYALREVLECFALESAWPRLKDCNFESLFKLVQKIEKTRKPEKRLEAQFLFDTQLHQLWVSQCNNPWLVSILDRLFIYRPNYRSNDTNVMADRLDLLEGAFEEHKKILLAISRGNLKEARRILRQHISHAGAILASIHRGN